MAERSSSGGIEQVRAASDIVEIIGARIPLKRAGTNFIALCPFHKEKTPSFNVSPQRQSFYCFGCHKGGDVFRFLQDYENVDFPEALRRLAERAGIVLDSDRDPQQKQARHLKEQLFQLHEEVAQRWQSVLAQDAAAQIARDYLSRRQVSLEAVKLFRLGYAPDQWEDTVSWAKAKGHPLGLLEQSGLIIRKEGENRYYDRFRGRLIFPIADDQGRVIAFSGRILADDVKTAKYVNSPETPIFAKRKVFYGLDKSKRPILDAQYAVVCEGQLDLIACFMAGLKNIVAPQGTAFTADHARLLKRYVNEVVLCFDSDVAGQSAAVRVLDDLLGSGLAIRVARVPAPHDPDSYIKEFGGLAFIKLITDAREFFDFYLDHLCQQNDPATDRGRLGIVKAMGEAVRKTENAVLVDKYAQKTALRLQVEMAAVRAEFRKMVSPGVSAAAGEELDAPPDPASARPGLKEFWLLKLAFQEGIELSWVAAHLDITWLDHPAVRRILVLSLDLDAQGRWQGPTAVLTDLADEEARSLLSEALADPRPIPNPEQQLTDLLLWLRNRAIDRQLNGILQQFASAALSDAAREDLTRQKLELGRLRRLPLTPRSPPAAP